MIIVVLECERRDAELGQDGHLVLPTQGLQAFQKLLLLIHTLIFDFLVAAGVRFTAMAGGFVRPRNSSKQMS